MAEATAALLSTLPAEKVDPRPARRLRAARQQRYELTKQEQFRSASNFAQSLGVGISTYLSHENGTRNFPAYTAQRYAKALDLPVAALLSDTKVPIVGAIKDSLADKDTVMFDGLGPVSFDPDGLVAHVIDGDSLYPRYSRGDRLLHEDLAAAGLQLEAVHGSECIVLLADGSKIVRQVIVLKNGGVALVAYDGKPPTLTANIVAAAPVRYVERAPPLFLKTP